MLEHGKAVEGSRRLGCNFGDRMYLFGSKDSLDTFAANPGKYAAGVRQAMSKIDAGSGGTIGA